MYSITGQNARSDLSSTFLILTQILAARNKNIPSVIDKVGETLNFNLTSKFYAIP